MAVLRRYVCWMPWRNEDEGETYIARSASAAKYQFALDLADLWSERETLLRAKVRSLGPLVAPVPDREVDRVAHYRGRPDLRLGTRVLFMGRSGERGVIVGAGGSCNFMVLFESGKHAGLRLYVHPSELVAEIEEGKR